MKIDMEDVVYVSETVIMVREARRRTTVPARIMKECGIKGGDSIRWTLLNDGTILVTPVRRK